MTAFMSQSLRSSHLTSKPRTASMFPHLLRVGEIRPTPGQAGKLIGRAAEFLNMEIYFSGWNKIN